MYVVFSAMLETLAVPVGLTFGEKDVTGELKAVFRDPVGPSHLVKNRGEI